MAGVGILKVRERVFLKFEEELCGRWHAPQELEGAIPYAPTDNLRWMYLSIPTGYSRESLGLPPRMETMMKRPSVQLDQLMKEDFHPPYCGYAFRGENREFVAIWQLRGSQKCRDDMLFLGAAKEQEVKLRFRIEGYALPKDPDLVYDERGLLYFNDVQKLKNILPKTRGILKAEHKKIVESLGETGRVVLSGDLNDANVSMDNLRKIPTAVQQLQRFSKGELQILRDYVEEVYEGEIAYDEPAGKYIIRSNAEMKKLLQVILEMVYITRITKQYRVAKNVVPLKRRSE